MTQTKKLFSFQRNNLSGVFNIVDNHLCKSEACDAGHFGLKCEGVHESFMGNIGVTLYVPEKHDQYRDMDVEIPPRCLPPTVSIIHL